jgi:hypothetical protein
MGGKWLEVLHETAPRVNRFAVLQGALVPRNPNTGIAGCCARAASGNVAATPPISVMNLRRRMCHPTTSRNGDCVVHDSKIGALMTELGQSRRS